MIRTQVMKHRPGAREGERGRSEGNPRGGAMDKSRYIRIIDGEGIRRDHPIEYFLLMGVKSAF